MAKRIIEPEARNEGLDGPMARLASDVARWTVGAERCDTGVPGLTMFRREGPMQAACGTYEPSVALIAQGRKRVVLGDDVYLYDARHFLITSMDLPTIAEVLDATPEKPYLSLLLRLDQRAIAQLMLDGNLPPVREPLPGRAMAVSEVTPELLGCFQRLVDLLDQPEDIAVIAPLVVREILYRLLVSDQGARLRQIGTTGTQSHKIARAVGWLKTHFAEPLRVDDLAGHVSMSASTFNHHFRKLTAMSPLQFQKWLRLNEARRLMLSEQMDAASAAFSVGYESPSQFSREYHRLFGAPPLRDITSLRRMTADVRA